MFVPPANPAHRHVAAFPCSQCTAPAGVLCLPECPASDGIEFAVLDEPDPARLAWCVPTCTNTTDYSGFWAILPDGSNIGIDDQQWRHAGALYGCVYCGRVFSAKAILTDRTHIQVLFRLDPPPILEPF